MFGQDNAYIHRDEDGSQDSHSVVVDQDGGVRVVIEEKTARLHVFLQSLPRNLLHGWPGWAVFVWINPVKKLAARARKPTRSAKKKPRTESESESDRKIFVTDELFVDDPKFLRVLASFLVKSFEIDRVEGGQAADLLGVKSESGGFQNGRTQKHTPKDKRTSGRETETETGGKKGVSKAGTAFAVAIPRMSQLPDLTEDSMAATLGRQRQGKVIGTKWHGVSAAVKIVYIDGDDGQYALDLFRSEVEAYRMAGSNGLWGKAVPGPLFVVDTDAVCAIGMVGGVSMPLDPLKWTTTDHQQAKESVLLLHQAGITLTDIKPANFVKLIGCETNGNTEVTVKRVVAIDLEGFCKDASDLELPDWLLASTGCRSR